MGCAQPIQVLKVGGSLLDLPDLGERVVALMALEPAAAWLVAPGGGAAADLVRAWDARCALGELRAHQLALSACSLTGRLLADLIPRAQFVGTLGAAREAWDEGRPAIADLAAFLDEAVGEREPLPTSWDASSDSIAARIAHSLGAAALWLAKSAPAPGPSPHRLAENGFVDPLFPAEAAGIPVVRVVNLRQGPPFRWVELASAAARPRE